MLLSIIIVNYNTAALTKACIESLLKQKFPGQLEIIVIDNASRDESVALLRSDFPTITVISHERNLGLAAGVNAGLAVASGTYTLILNPDIIALPGALHDIVRYLDEHPTVGIVGGQLLSPSGKIQFSCYRFYRPVTVMYRRTWLGSTPVGRRETARFLMKDFDRLQPRAVDWLMGACLAVRQRAVREVGGMDERFFLYFEDVDWCRRFWQSGWRVVYLPTAQFSHYHQRSSERGGIFGIVHNRATREHIKSAVKYFWKYRGHSIPRSE
jgi:N-acetylglucosaminyl-diphospho-decaprenol L-rhamnosyltransferase